MTENNVIDLKTRKPCIFSYAQRERLIKSITPLPESPEMTIQKIEDDLCAQIIEKCRKFSSILGEKAAHKIGRLLFK